MGQKAALENQHLYHIKRTIIDYHEDPSGATQITDILKTFTDLSAAKAAARKALFHEGYVKDDFQAYEESDGTATWDAKHGEGVIVWAKAPAGQLFTVRLETTPKPSGLTASAEGVVQGHLYYVLQTTINYAQDRTGASQSTEIEGTYATHHAAIEAAQTTLLDDTTTKASFAEYDEKRAFKDEWPYGDRVLVHAVADTGENFLVAVKGSPHGHGNHECGAHGGRHCDCECGKMENCKQAECKHAECEFSK